MRALVLALVAVLGAGCAGAKPTSSPKARVPSEARGGGLVVMASTIGPVEAGIVPALEEAFERDNSREWKTAAR